MPQKEYWSASRIDTANYCNMKYYLRYIDPIKPKSLRISPYVKGSLLHKIIEDFWDHLGTFDEVEKDKKNNKKKAKEKKKYYDAESFGKYAQGKWTQTVIRNKGIKDINKKIFWRGGYDDDSEAWEIRATMPGMTAALYRVIIEEGPPLYSELAFDFVAEGLRFKGFIDEVRLRDGKVVIRDYKSGSPFWIREMKRDFDPQLTFYNAGLSSLFYDNNEKSIEFAKSLGLEEQREELIKSSNYINPDFEEEYFMVEAPYLLEKIDADKDFAKKFSTRPEIIHKTKRTEEHFYHLIDNIKKTKNKIEEGNISFEHGKKCDMCDMKHVCRKHSLEPLETNVIDKRGNLLLSFMDPPYSIQSMAEKQKEEKDKPKENQRKFDYRRKEPWRGRD